MMLMPILTVPIPVVPYLEDLNFDTIAMDLVGGIIFPLQRLRSIMRRLEIRMKLFARIARMANAE